MGELVVAGRYWCHMCATAVIPVAAEAGVEIKCPYCSSGFLEEMETARSVADNGGSGGGGTYPGADNAISIWAPIIDRFHSACILQWLEMHSSCPVCRFQLPADDDPKSSCGSGSGSNSGGTYVNADLNDNGEGHGNDSGDGGAETAGNAAAVERDGGLDAEGNGSRLPASIQWLNSLFSQPGSSPPSTSASGSSWRHYED